MKMHSGNCPLGTEPQILPYILLPLTRSLHSFHPPNTQAHNNSNVKSRKNQRANWSKHNKKNATPHQLPWSKWTCQFGKDRGCHSRLPVRAGRWGKCWEHQPISTTSHGDEAELQPETSPAIVTVQTHCQSHTIQGLPLWLLGLAWSLQFQPDFLTTWQSPAAITLFPCPLFIPSFVSLNPQAEKEKKKKHRKGKKQDWSRPDSDYILLPLKKKIHERGFPFSVCLDHSYFWL